MQREKMSNIKRAAQFSPFDTLKGLQDALRLKETEREKIVKGELSEDEASEISNQLINTDNGDILEVCYYDNGLEKVVKGKSKLVFEEGVLIVDKEKILIDNLKKVKNISKN